MDPIVVSLICLLVIQLLVLVLLGDSWLTQQVQMDELKHKIAMLEHDCKALEAEVRAATEDQVKAERRADQATDRCFKLEADLNNCRTQFRKIQLTLNPKKD